MRLGIDLRVVFLLVAGVEALDFRGLGQVGVGEAKPTQYRPILRGRHAASISPVIASRTALPRQRDDIWIHAKNMKPAEVASVATRLVLPACGGRLIGPGTFIAALHAGNRLGSVHCRRV